MSISRDTNNKKPAVGFCIITHNSAQYIQKCLKSIINLNSITPIVAIFDNGSTDNTAQILQTASDTMGRKKIKHQIIYSEKNLGTTISRNKNLAFLMEKDVDYICILDSDTVINDNAISTLIKVLKADSTIGLIGPSMKDKAGDIQKTARKFPTITEKFFKAMPFKSLQAKGESYENYIFGKGKATNDSDYLLSACWLMPKNTVTLVGNFDEKIFYAPEDVDYCARVWRKGLRCCFAPNAIIVHDYQRISKKKFFSIINLQHIRGLVYYFKKYGYISNIRKIIDRGES